MFHLAVITTLWHLRHNLWQRWLRPHPVRILLAVNGTFPAADIIIITAIILIDNHPHYQLLLHLFHLLLLDLLGLHLIYKLGPSLF